MKAFKRNIELSILINGVLKTYRPNDDGLMLRVDFSVVKSVKGAPSSGDIMIYGLAKEDIAFISTNFNPLNGILNPSFLRLSVGYGENISEILSGNIVTAIPNLDSSENSIQLNIQSGFLNNLDKNQVFHSLKDASLKQVAQNIAENNGVKLDFRAKDEKVGSYAFIGSPLLQISRFREAYPSKLIFIEGDSLIVDDLSSGGKKVFLIDRESGMIGSPKPTSMGCEIQTLLNPYLNIGDALNLESEKLPQLNGRYFIFQLSHQGSNRSDAWMSKIVAQNRGGVNA